MSGGRNGNQSNPRKCTVDGLVKMPDGGCSLKRRERIEQKKHWYVNGGTKGIPAGRPWPTVIGDETRLVRSCLTGAAKEGLRYKDNENANTSSFDFRL